jgi:hypothetical protein
MMPVSVVELVEDLRQVLAARQFAVHPGLLREETVPPVRIWDFRARNRR